MTTVRASLLLTVLLASCGCTPRGTPSATGPMPVDLDYPVGPFSLTERCGATVTDKDLHGSVWIASFVFTRCTGPCPQVTATVRRLQEELKDVPQVKFVTFTVDPNRDDVSSLKEYAKHFQADEKRWLFLTGDEATIHKLMREQFKQAIEKKSGEVKPGDEFGHSTRLILVDRDCKIRATYPGTMDEHDPESRAQFDAGLARLKERARELAK